ncbi:MAG: HD domain-containing protein [Candidatus Cryptobacteroides sp.]
MKQIIYSSRLPDIIAELSRTEPMLRIGKVGMNCGCEYTSFPMFRNLAAYSRLEHSTGVASIVWEHTQDIVQTIAGLFHDIATPVFAHVIDFMNGDYMRQESTESRTRELIEDSPELMSILSKAGIAAEDVSDYHRFPIADNDSPKLSADRLEYTLGNMVNFGFASSGTAQRLYDDIFAGVNEYGEPELVFHHAGLARQFAVLSLQCSEIYTSDADRYSMQMLSELVKSAIEAGVLQKDDLYSDEPEVISKLCSCPEFYSRWSSYCRMESIFHPEKDTPDSRILDAKRRCIDPYTDGQARTSQMFPDYKAALDHYRTKDLCYRICAG